jgi:hypothetical protein
MASSLSVASTALSLAKVAVAHSGDQGYWKNRLSQQLFKVFIYTYILPLHVSAFAGPKITKKFW